MRWLDKWLGVDKSAPAEGTPPAAQTSMTLEERMAFRRQMVLDSVRDVMSNHGLLSPGYRASVTRLDLRGHQYAVMVDMMPATAGRSVDSPGELHAMEARITRTALHRYKIKVAGVYWRVAQEHAPPVALSPTAVDAAGAGPLTPPSTPQPVFLRRKTDHPKEDGFPDTLVETRAQENRDLPNADKRVASERTPNAGTLPQSASWGRQTPETDGSLLG